MAATAFPTWAYNATAPAQLVANQAALTALGVSWVLTPFAPPGAIAPFDPGFVDTDIRLQQILAELRVNNLICAQAFGIADAVDSTGLRTDIVATDIALTT